MRILLLNQFFWPDERDGAELLTDVARHLAALGHKVTVICCRSRYAGEDRGEAPPVRVLRVPDIPFLRHGPLRLLSYVWFLAAAMCRGLLAPRPDIVVTLTTPPLLSLVGTLLKAVRGSRHFIWEMDVYPDIAVDLRMLSVQSSFTHALQRLADASRRRADGIIVLGECVRERLLLRGLSPRAVHVAENWADGREIQPMALPAGPFTVLYSGNRGMAHDFETITAAMNVLKTNDRLRFVFAGEGPLREELEYFCRSRGIGRVQFLAYSGRAEFGASLARGHVGLVTQRRETVGSVVPSEVYALLAAGRPFVFVGPRGATPNRVIERFGCGWQVNCGDVQALITLLEALARNPVAVREAALLARKAFEAHYDLPAGVSRICEALGITKPTPGAIPAAPKRPFKLIAFHSSLHR